MKSKYFNIKELVPKETYNELKEESWDLLNPKAIETINIIREILGVEIICNNWQAEGSRNYCGYRPKDCKIGAKYSRHKEGDAFDFISKHMTAKEMRDKIYANKHLLPYNIRIEKYNSKGEEISWLHVDLKETKDKVYFFRA